MANILELREINKLIKERFFFPTYQRGYRWDERQVRELLEDVYEFMQTGRVQDGEYYCLQPVVVKKREDGKYEVIDGQQRLTTIFIIQKFLMKRTYQIEYASRAGSKDYLENINNQADGQSEKSDRNVDYYFMSKAYDTVKEWFVQREDEDEDYTIRDEFNTYLGKYCKVIWYEVEEDANAESIFTRLNIGKIPLTNAELIKALFLRKRNFDKDGENYYLRQLEIASEWDMIENSLQNDEVWYFINPRYAVAPATRIEYIFDIISGKSSHDHRNYTFIEFLSLIEENGIIKVWENVKKHYQIIMEWYQNHELYHLIGFLTSSKSSVSVTDLINTYYSEKYKKSELKNYIISEIREYFGEINIDELSYVYSGDQVIIKDLLLLFNVITVMNKSSAYSRFPFDSYNKNKWSLEHIHAQNSEGMGNSKELWLSWIDEHLKSFRQFPDKKYEEVVKALEEVDRENLTKEEFDDLFNEICDKIKDDYGVDLHCIDNLALLVQKDNSSVGNHFFDVKRNMIIEKDRRGEFIPICTRNVFLKYYSSDPSQIHYWSATDRKDYLATIKSVLTQYVKFEEGVK